MTDECAQALDACTPDLYHKQGCRFIGDDQANRLLARAMREPWTV